MRALIHPGAKVSTVNLEFCQKYELKIKSPDKFLQLEGTRGFAVPYLGYACQPENFSDF